MSRFIYFSRDVQCKCSEYNIMYARCLEREQRREEKENDIGKDRKMNQVRKVEQQRTLKKKKIMFHVFEKNKLVQCPFKRACLIRADCLSSGIAACSFLESRSSKQLHTALPWVLSNTPAKCGVNQMNGCRDY